MRSGQLHLAFARAGKKPGIVYARRRGSRWTRPLRLTKRRDAQPTIAVRANGSRQIVFRRRGLFVLRGGRRWTVIRLPGTAAADTEPWVAASGSGLSLVFARLGGAAPGIYVSRTSAITGRWPARPRRLSSIRTDRNPSLRADGFARETIVFERG